MTLFDYITTTNVDKEYSLEITKSKVNSIKRRKEKRDERTDEHII